MILWCAAAMAAPWFEDVTAASGIDRVGPSFSAALADVDGDGDLDVALTNHAEPGQLWRGVGDGRFVLDEAAWSVELGAGRRYDAHGAVWFDVDGDGDLDLLESVGAQRGRGVAANRVWLQQDGGLVERAEALGLSYGAGAGRAFVPLDLDMDGVGDLVLAHTPRVDGTAPTSWLRGQGAGAYAAPSAGLPAAPRTLLGLSVLDLDGQGGPEIVHWGQPDRVSVVRWDGASWGVDDVRSRALSMAGPADVVWGDWNGDGLVDAIVLPKEAGSELRQVGDRELRFGWHAPPTTEAGFAFSTSGVPTITVDPPFKWAEGSIRAGATCAPSTGRSWTADASVSGACASEDSGIVTVGRDGERWRVQVRSDAFIDIAIRVTSDATIGAPTLLASPPRGPQTHPELHTPRVLSGTTDGFVVEEAWQLPGPMSCPAGVPIDVDLDGWLDVYLACSSATANLPNRLFRNTGSGFEEIVGHGGEGSAKGRAGPVVRGDLDGDGREDLLLLQGHGGPPWEDDGPVQVLAGRGPAGHALRLDLVGAPGFLTADTATVRVRVGDRVVRRDLVSGGRWIQPSRRVVIGLGEALRADALEVRWPDGGVTKARNVEAGRVRTIRHPERKRTTAPTP